MSADTHSLTCSVHENRNSGEEQTEGGKERKEQSESCDNVAAALSEKKKLIWRVSSLIAVSVSHFGRFAVCATQKTPVEE